MSYVNRPVDDVIHEPAASRVVADYHDRIRYLLQLEQTLLQAQVDQEQLQVM